MQNAPGYRLFSQKLGVRQEKHFSVNASSFRASLVPNQFSLERDGHCEGCALCVIMATTARG